MNKAYSRIKWENYPSLNTPLNETNLNKMDAAVNELDDRVITLDTTKVAKTEITSLIANWTMDESTGIITITKVSGEQIVFDLNIEKIPVGFTLSDDGILTMTTDDGTEFTANIGAMIPALTFDNSDTIAVTSTGSGVNKTYSFSIKTGSVTEDLLQPNYLADIKVETANSLQNATNATSEANRATTQADRATTEADRAEAAADKAEEIIGIDVGGIIDGTVTVGNADKLDGLDSTAFAILANNNAFTGKNTVPTADTSDNSTQIASTAFVKNRMVGIGLLNGAGNEWDNITKSTTLGVTFFSNHSNSTDFPELYGGGIILPTKDMTQKRVLYIVRNAVAYIGMLKIDASASTYTLTWNKVGDGGNATTLDSYDSSAFIRHTLDYGWSTFGTNDLNTWGRDGVYAFTNETANIPVSGQYGTVIVFASQKARIMQIGKAWYNKVWYIRYSNDTGATWTDWVNIADGGNADTLDGYNSSDFVKTADTAVVKIQESAPTDTSALWVW